MKRRMILLCGLLIVLFSCHNTKNPLIGVWKADKVNIEFDEQKSTPEMIRQLGESEKNGIIEFLTDSTLRMTYDGVANSYSYFVKENGEIQTIRLDSREGPNILGVYRDGRIVSVTQSPFGTINVSYKKE